MNVDLVKKLGKLSEKHEGQVEGLDQIIFDAFNFRCMIYCLNEVPYSDFNETSLFSLFDAGVTTSIVINIGKLTDTTKGVNSLRKLWDDFKTAVPAQEKKEIDKEFQNKKILGAVMGFRNELVAHNTKTREITWLDIDASLKFLIRVWHLISEQSGCPVIGPTYDFIAVNHGFNQIFSRDELITMEKAWIKYSLNFKIWMHEPIC